MFFYFKNLTNDDDDDERNDNVQKKTNKKKKPGDQVQIISLARTLSVSVTVCYIDGRSDSAVDHVFGEGKINVCMLYRPGHYDVVYRCDS